MDVDSFGAYLVGLVVEHYLANEVVVRHDCHMMPIFRYSNIFVCRSFFKQFV
jgi:hypothetical protein